MQPINNNNTKKHYSLQTKSLVLKPYCKKYVKQYNSWFQNDQQLLYLTGSQPLTYEQELENHKSWLTDQKKYTFLVFYKGPQQEKSSENNNNNNNSDKLIGDVNLFFSDWIQPNQAEINIMLAVKEYRNKGLAKQIMQVIEKFAYAVYNKNEVIAKIKDDNKASIKFFQKIGYQFINHNVKHQEVQYRKSLLSSEKQNQIVLKQLVDVYKMKEEKQIKELFELEE